MTLPNYKPKRTLKKGEKAARALQKAQRTAWDIRLVNAWGLGRGLVHEHQFALPRRWRFDWCWPEWKVALEIEGGGWTGGRHTRGVGFAKDMQKYNHAAVLGWTVVRCSPDDFRTGKFASIVRPVLASKGWRG